MTLEQVCLLVYFASCLICLLWFKKDYEVIEAFNKKSVLIELMFGPLLPIVNTLGAITICLLVISNLTGKDAECSNQK